VLISVLSIVSSSLATLRTVVLDVCVLGVFRLALPGKGS